MSAKRYFTPEDASRTLPLVRRIVADVLRTGRTIRHLEREPKASDEREHRRQMKRLEALFAELEDLGCYYKDWSFSVGLVDFPAQFDGTDVMLCWRSDEEELSYYHGVNEGYGRRRRIPAAYLSSIH